MADPVSFTSEVKDAADWERLAAIFGQVLGPREVGRMRAAFEATTCRRFAYLGDRVAGAGRIITDGLYYGLLVDVVVAAGAQGAGIAGRLVQTLVADAGVRLVIAQSVPAVMPFYERLGFRTMLTGMACYDDPAAAIELGYVEP